MDTILDIRNAIICLCKCVDCRRRAVNLMLRWTLVYILLAGVANYARASWLGHDSPSATFISKCLNFSSFSGLFISTALLVYVLIYFKIRERQHHLVTAEEINELQEQVEQQQMIHDEGYDVRTTYLLKKPVALKSSQRSSNRSSGRVFYEGDDLACSICLEEYDQDDLVVTTPCNHRFHIDCLKKHHHTKFTCPQCTRALQWKMVLA